MLICRAQVALCLPTPTLPLRTNSESITGEYGYRNTSFLCSVSFQFSLVLSPQLILISSHVLVWLQFESSYIFLSIVYSRVLLYMYGFFCTLHSEAVATQILRSMRWKHDTISRIGFMIFFPILDDREQYVQLLFESGV